MACIVPKCSCTVFKKTTNKSAKGSLLQYDNNCNGCGHNLSLHRNCTTRDSLIIDEIKTAASKPCSGHIPASKLPSLAMFNMYSLIPLSPDDPSNEEALCTCKGFSAGDISEVLYNYTNFSYADTVDELPLLACAVCTHPLLNHQSEPSPRPTPSEEVVVVESNVMYDTLLEVRSCDSHVMLCMLVEDGNGRWGLVCGCWPKKKQETVELNISTKKKGRKRLREEVDPDNFNIMKQIKATLTDSDHIAIELKAPPPHQLSCASNGSVMTLAISQESCISVYQVDLPVKKICLLETIRGTEDVPITLLLLSASGCYLCAGFSSRRVKVWKHPFSDSFLEVAVGLSPVTHGVWDPEEQNVFLGSESGQVVCYSINEDSVVFSKQISSGPITTLKWISSRDVIRGVAVGSADGCVYLVSKHCLQSLTSDGPIKKFFSVQQPLKLRDKISLSATLQGHRSFVGSIDVNNNHLVSVGWDRVLMYWPLLLVTETELKGCVPPVEDEPDRIYRIGPHYDIQALPIGLWSISDQLMLVAYRQMDKKLAFVFYY